MSFNPLPIHGNFSTRTMGDIYYEPYDERTEKIGAEYFEYHYLNSGLGNRLLSQSDFEADTFEYDNIGKYSLSTIYALLMSEFANNHIKSGDEERFKLQVDALIWTDGPEWQRDMLMAEKKVKMPFESMTKGSGVIYNHAQHPDTNPSTATLDELEYIDDQNTTRYKTSDIDTIGKYEELTHSAATSRFINKFRKLFITVAYPAEYSLYVSEE